MAWQPIEIVGKRSWENLGDMVANEHLGKCVKCILTDIQVAGSLNCDEVKIW